MTQTMPVRYDSAAFIELVARSSFPFRLSSQRNCAVANKLALFARMDRLISAHFFVIAIRHLIMMYCLIGACVAF